MSKTASLLIAMVALGMADPAMAQSTKRTPLQTFDVPGTHYETVIAVVEFVPNATGGRRTHLGPEAGYVLEGEVTLSVPGQPDKRFKAGESYHVPAGVVHDARSGPSGFKVLMTYVVDRRQPLDQLAD
jgi:quercetin dioxygenase-like cupin family protein